MTQHHVLVCEDEDFVREALSDYLRSSGYLVTEAANGLQCLDAVKKNSPDVILLDLKMPEMDGEQTVHQIRALGIKAPIFVLTGLGTTDEPMDIEKLGIKGFIPKPYRLAEVNKLLKGIFND